MSGFRRSVLGEMVYSLPPAIRWILASCVLIWFGQLIVQSAGWRPAQIVIYEWLALYDPWPWVWQFVTYAFLHDPQGILHIAFNMFMLWMFGRELEQRWGSLSFAQFYVTCAVGAGLLHVLVAALFPIRNQLGQIVTVPVLGASGAIMGLFAAYGMLFPNRTLLLALIFPVKAKYAVLIAAVISLALSFQSNPNGGVAHLAHLGGMLTGYLYLKQGWRLARFRPIQALKEKLEAARRARKRARFDVIDEKQWDAWLKDDAGDETQH